MLAFDRCFQAVVSGAQLEELAAYDVKPKGIDEWDNANFGGEVVTDLGTMPLEASIRHDVLFMCKMGSVVPDPAVVTFEDAEDSILAWFDWLDTTGVAQRIETLPFHVYSVLCLPENSGVAVSVSAMTMSSARAGASEIDPPIPDQLEFTVILTLPNNFDECKQDL